MYIYIYKYVLHVYVYIYIYIYIHSTMPSSQPPSYPPCFLHCAGGSLSAGAHTTGSSWRGPLEISSGKVRVQRGSRSRVPLIPSGVQPQESDPDLEPSYSVGVQPEIKKTLLNLKAAKDFAHQVKVCSEERAVAGLSSL